MKTCFNFLRASSAALVLLIASFFCVSAHAQVNTLMSQQTFSSSLPSGWTQSEGWSWESVGNGGSNGSAQCDDWDYYSETDYLTTSSVNASAYAAAVDSVWVDFDFFWEYNQYVTYGADTWEVLANSTTLQSGTEASLYTWYNTSDGSSAPWADYQTSSSYWQHYHLLVPVAARTSNMTITFEILPNYGCSNPLIDNVTITGKNIPPAELALLPQPKSLNFGTATPNSPDTQYVTVKNVGAAGTELHLQGFTFQGSSAYSVLSKAGWAKTGDSILAGNQETLALQFLPFTSGTLTGTLGITTNGADSGAQTVALTGVGAVPTVSYSTSSMFVGTETELDSTSGVQYLYINSTGVGPLTIKSVNFIGLDGGKAYIITHTPQSVIPPGGVDSVGIKFFPDIEGRPDAHLVINSTAVNVPWDTVLLSGIGILPHLALTAVSPGTGGTNMNHVLLVSFDSVQMGYDSCLSVTVSNPGSDTLSIMRNFLSSKDFDFAYAPLTAPDTLIPPGGSQTLQVCFTPIQQGYRTATVELRTNIPLTKTTPAQDTSTFSIQFVGHGVPSGKLAITGPSTNGNVDENKKDNSSCVTDTAWNTGAANITLSSLMVSGTNASDFTTSGLTFPVTVPAGGYLTFQVCADPTDTGAETATLTGTATSGGQTQNATLGLNVYGSLIANQSGIGVPLSSLTCDTETATVTVMNNGNVADTYTATINGPDASDFTITSATTSPTINGGGGMFTFTVKFTPTKVGAETASVTVTRSSDGLADPPIALAGIGGAATIAGSTTVTGMVGMPTTFTVPIKNTGTCDWTPGVPAQTTDQAFAYVSGGTTPITAGSSGSLTYTYTPMQAGTDNATLSFPSQSAMPSSISVTINGTAAASGVAPSATSNGFALGQAYPNPSNGTSDVEITVPTPSMLTLTITDMQGNVVQTALDRHFDAGTYDVMLDASALANGTYFYTLTCGDVHLTRELTLLK